MIGFSFKISEIENGWIVEFFSEKGPVEADHTEYFETFDKAQAEVKAWYLRIIGKVQEATA